jgi:hypothetical protein
MLRAELKKPEPNEEDVVNLGWLISCARHRLNGCSVELVKIGKGE